MTAGYWPVRLQHREVVLRPLRRRDRTAWDAVRQHNREWLEPWEATQPPGAEPGPPTFTALVRVLDRQARLGQLLPWALCWDPTGGQQPDAARLVGQVTVSGITRGSAMFAQIGYWIDRRAAGRGMVPVGVALATDYCFRDLGLHRMEVAIRPENGNSLRVVEKLGFRHEGLRPRYLHINGDWRDHEIFALHREEVPGGLLARWEMASQRPE
ncbi:GNAT family N-acetyltransferase [Granulicoccus sp. GXG6511]|uniref:GNAT family N-acetyltransferase n=1 Tax=Granulicoccus sp. GXG6511 TaxID=3381351 RepID=UPI003D7D02A7